MAQIILTHDSFAVSGFVSSEEEVGQKSPRSFLSANWKDEYTPDTQNRPVEAAHLQGKVCHAQLQVTHFRESSREWLTSPAGADDEPRWWKTIPNLNSVTVARGRQRPWAPGCYWFLSPSKWIGYWVEAHRAAEEGNYKRTFRQEGLRLIVSLMLPSSAHIQADRGDV